MVALSIAAEHKRHRNSDFIIINSFEKARDIHDRLTKLNNQLGFTNTFIFNNLPDAYKHIQQLRYQHLYIDSDVGLKKHVQLLLLKLNSPFTSIFVYEEGLGTYRTDLYTSKIKKYILNIIGAGTFFGGSQLTKAIYLYDPDKYKNSFKSNSQKKIIKIKTNLSSFIDENIKELKNIFDHRENQAKSACSNCSIYLSSWTVDTNFIDTLIEKAGDKYIKLHPKLTNPPQLKDFIKIENQIPAELILKSLSTQYKSVTVYHHGTSTQTYINARNITFVNINEKS